MKANHYGKSSWKGIDESTLYFHQPDKPLYNAKNDKIVFTNIKAKFNFTVNRIVSDYEGGTL